MTTVLIVSDAYYPIIDGVTRFVDALGYACVNAGYTVNMVIPNIRENIVFDYDSRPFNFTFLPTIPIKVKDYFICLPNLELKNVIEASDIIIVNSLAFATAYVIFFNRYYNLPIIEFVHTDEREILHFTVNLPSSLLNKLFNFMKKMTKQIDYFAVATNKFRKRTIDYGVKPSKIFRVPFGYSPKPVKEKQLLMYQQEMNIDKDLPTILYLGRLSEEKNIERIVEVMGKISKEHDIQCLIAGFGHQMKYIKKRIHDSNYKITILGKVPDSKLPIVYTISDILFSPSFHESLGFTIVEAMSYAIVPAVNGKYQEEKLNENNSIQLVDVTDIHLMKKQLLEIINNPTGLERMKENAYSTSKSFSWEKFDKIWVDKIEGIMSSR